MLKSKRKHQPRVVFAFVLLAVLLATGAWGIQAALAKDAQVSATQASPIHPAVELLDVDGENVLSSGKPVSTLQTCGACHDTQFIVEHSFHAQVGLDEYTAPGQTEGGHSWDTSPGTFGKWSPLAYRYLSPLDDEIIDLTTPEWIMSLGLRHVGDGPAMYSRSGQHLTELAPDANNPETAIRDPESGALIAWDWQESGVIEMNCFLCHLPQPNNEARKATIEAGQFGWANTATLLGSGIITQTAQGYSWSAQAFNADGLLEQTTLQIQDPSNQNCGLCHGLVHDELDEPIVITSCSPERYSTITTGQIVTGQRPKDSGMNLADKASLNRAWDIHSERLLECTDCHFSLNNPVYYRENPLTRPDHLIFDPRRIDFGEYLYQPLHQFARGQSAQGTIVPELKDTMRRCESCHSIEATHDWLPYKEGHIEAISCETCHIPEVYSSAARQFDWTVITLDGKAASQCRGIEGDQQMSMSALVTGYEPVLMPRLDVDGDFKLSPYNLISYWYWVYGDPERPVPLQALKDAYLNGDNYRPEVLAIFDTNQDGQLDNNELIIDHEAKENLIRDQLAALGLNNPRIAGEVQPYSINHTVAHGEWALRDCQDCHNDQSRLTQAMRLASYVPGGIVPEFITESNVVTNGEIYQDASGAIYFRPASQENGLYIFGHNSVGWIDLIGSLMFAGVLLGVGAHSTLRFLSSRRYPKHATKIEKVYMYGVYERLWHWLQTAAILILLLTGLVIHKPNTFGLFSFNGVVIVHNVVAGILAINAALSLFYHLASGEIRQYIPRPYGFFDQAISQALYYVRGIFNRQAHPFEKTPQKKLNPLQQATYFAILNVLLPLQGITGVLMWGAQHWPDLSENLGGLPFLAPFHTLIAWTFAAFIVAHVYLTTTGHTPLAGIKSMIMGWDEIEVHAPTIEPQLAPSTEAQPSQGETIAEPAD